jgi:hypothetical protein
MSDYNKSISERLINLKNQVKQVFLDAENEVRSGASGSTSSPPPPASFGAPGMSQPQPQPPQPQPQSQPQPQPPPPGMSPPPPPPVAAQPVALRQRQVASLREPPPDAFFPPPGALPSNPITSPPQAPEPSLLPGPPPPDASPPPPPGMPPPGMPPQQGPPPPPGMPPPGMPPQQGPPPIPSGFVPPLPPPELPPLLPSPPSPPPPLPRVHNAATAAQTMLSADKKSQLDELNREMKDKMMQFMKKYEAMEGEMRQFMNKINSNVGMDSKLNEDLVKMSQHIKEITTHLKEMMETRKKICTIYIELCNKKYNTGKSEDILNPVVMIIYLMTHQFKDKKLSLSLKKYKILIFRHIMNKNLEPLVLQSLSDETTLRTFQEDMEDMEDSEAATAVVAKMGVAAAAAVAADLTQKAVPGGAVGPKVVEARVTEVHEAFNTLAEAVRAVERAAGEMAGEMDAMLQMSENELFKEQMETIKFKETIAENLSVLKFPELNFVKKIGGGRGSTRSKNNKKHKNISKKINQNKKHKTLLSKKHKRLKNHNKTKKI